jgi:hypothetical protein
MTKILIINPINIVPRHKHKFNLKHKVILKGMNKQNKDRMMSLNIEWYQGLNKLINNKMIKTHNKLRSRISVNKNSILKKFNNLKWHKSLKNKRIWKKFIHKLLNSLKNKRVWKKFIGNGSSLIYWIKTSEIRIIWMKNFNSWLKCSMRYKMNESNQYLSHI